MPTGVDVYLRPLVAHLGRLDPTSPYTVFVNREDRAGFAGTLPANFRLAPLAWRSRALRFGFQQLVLPAVVRTRGIDVVHSPSFLMPWHRGRARHVVTIHDLTFFSHRAQHSRLHRSAGFLRLIAAARPSRARSAACCVTRPCAQLSSNADARGPRHSPGRRPPQRPSPATASSRPRPSPDLNRCRLRPRSSTCAARHGRSTALDRAADGASGRARSAYDVNLRCRAVGR